MLQWHALDAPELARLLDLIPREWPADRFVLCGSAALAVRGVRDVHDLDVMIHPSLWREARALAAEHGEKPTTERYATDPDANPAAGRLVRLACGIDFWDTHPRIARVADFKRSIDCSDLFEIGGRFVHVLGLRHVLAIKALAMVPGREKDLDDMCLLSRLIREEEESGIRSWAAVPPPPPPPPPPDPSWEAPW
jgi:hypothetical protein